MNESLYIFLFTGVVSMSSALSIGSINKMDEADRPSWAQVRRNMMLLVLTGNVAALTLVGSMAYGFQLLHWSIPLSSIFITFPVIHQLIAAKFLGVVKPLVVTIPLTFASAVMLYLNWP